MDELRPFSYTVLALVGDSGAGPHDIVQMMRRGRVFWTAADSHYYAEPKRLEQLGYLESEQRPGRTHSRTFYRLTPKGRGALARWVSESAGFPRIQHEAVVKVLSGDIAGPDAVLASLQGLKDEIAELNRRLDSGEDVIATLPHRAPYLRLVHSLGRALLRVHEDWVAEVERTLGGT